MEEYKTWEDYFSVQPKAGKDMLLKIKKVFEENLPEAIESWGYGVPAYDLVPNAKLSKKIMIAGFKKHISIYPRKETIEVFKERLTEYKVLNGTIQIKHTQDLPIDLIKEMIIHTYKLVKEEE